MPLIWRGRRVFLFSLAGWVERCCRLACPYVTTASSGPAVRSRGIWWDAVYGCVWQSQKVHICVRKKEEWWSVYVCVRLQETECVMCENCAIHYFLTGKKYTAGCPTLAQTQRHTQVHTNIHNTWTCIRTHTHSGNNKNLAMHLRKYRNKFHLSMNTHTRPCTYTHTVLCIMIAGWARQKHDLSFRLSVTFFHGQMFLLLLTSGTGYSVHKTHNDPTPRITHTHTHTDSVQANRDDILTIFGLSHTKLMDDNLLLFECPKRTSETTVYSIMYFVI